ncbi:MAG TPA: transglutaminase domain-containing protein [Deltaproteobacteria bacterium]|nr:transglutaminase domain-containing protein [Deltaproteobacteria bacterium]
MSTPLFLLGATILFWGWQLQITFIAAVLAVLAEGTRLLKWKCDFSNKDFSYISDFCSILLVAMIIYIVASNRSAKTLLLIIKWLPLPLYPLVFFQSLSTSRGIELGSLLWIYRKNKNNKPEILKRKVDVAYPYMAICVLSASIANNRSITFYVTFCALCAWALLSFRSKRYSSISWIMLIVVVTVLGYCGHVSLHYLQRQLEETFTKWFTELIGIGTGPYKSTTSMGDILELKHSSQIIARVKPREGEKPPRFLRTATYNIFRTSVWFDSSPYFRPVLFDSKSKSWKIATSPGKPREATIYYYLDGGTGILPIPPGTYRIANLFVSRAQINRLGTLKVEEGPDLISYDAFYSRKLTGDPLPNPNDLKVPQNEDEALSRIAQELGLYSMSPAKAVERVDTFFRSRFIYSMNPSLERKGLSPLTYFLLKGHSGHCEYFATATVLLLRKIGIPARYATGYVVREYSRMEKMFVVRQRHAHAWTLVYLNGRWQNLDTTPQAWYLQEKSLSPDWEPLYDLWSKVVFVYYKWKWGDRKSLISGHVILWIILPLSLFLIIRLYSRKGLVRQISLKGKKRKLKPVTHQGIDSDFYTIVETLIELGYERHPWESMKEWIDKIGSSPPLENENGDLQQILRLHYRYRFDPMGIKSGEKEKLTKLVDNWHRNLKHD